MAPLIEFLNHASFIVETEGKQLLVDPWLFGSAFNNGWDLLCDYRFEPERFRSIDYLWFSHEHPDHFSPPVLKAIPEDTRRGITVLFQETKDKKVLEFCAGLGFKTQELPNHKSVRLAEGLSLTCGKVPFFDSWLLLEVEGLKILNINDCVVDGEGVAEEIQRITGTVDLIFTQFSYAAWKGNVGDTKLRQESAQSKLEIVKTQLRVFKPTWTIPFASFIYFSHEENRYNNDSINHPSDALHAIIEAGSIPVLMYPGDRWEVGCEWKNEDRLRWYDVDYNLDEKVYHTSLSVPESKLVESARKYIERLFARNSRMMITLLQRLPGLSFFRPIDLYLHDLGFVYTFSLQEGLLRKGTPISGTRYDVSMHSESLDFIFRFDWGYDTLTVNGRFETDMEGFGKMTKLFAIGPLNNTGRFVQPSLLLDVRIITSFFRGLRRFMRRLKRHNV